jgi:hypothetical protein
VFERRRSDDEKFLSVFLRHRRPLPNRGAVKKAPVKGPISLVMHMVVMMVVVVVVVVMMMVRIAGKSRGCDSQGEKCSEDIGE